MSNFTEYSTTADYLIAIPGLLLGTYTIVANSLVLVIISRFSRRTNSELIFANLAIADLLGGFDFIFACGILLAGRKYFDLYLVDDVFCQVVTISWYVVSISTPLMLALTCLGRFLAVFTPMRYENLFTRGNVMVCLGVVWMISLIGGTLHIYKLGTMAMEPRWAFCDYRLSDIYSVRETRWLMALFFCAPLLLSTLFLVVCNTVICVKLLQMRLRIIRRIGKKISVANGLQAVLSANLAVADTQAARRLTNSEADQQQQTQDCKARPAAKRRIPRISVFELEAVVQAEDEDDGEGEGSPCLDNGGRNAHFHTKLGVNNLEKITGSTDILNEPINLEPTKLTVPRCLFLKLAPNSLCSRPSLKSGASNAGSLKSVIKLPHKRCKNGRKELNIVLVTVLFSLNFLLWKSIMVFYYFSSLLSLDDNHHGDAASRHVFRGVSGVTETYLHWWYYSATFMTSCVNPIIHFVCNSKMKRALIRLYRSSRGGNGYQ